MATKPVSILPHGNTLINRQLRGDAREAALERVGSLFRVSLSPMSASDIEMIAVGAYSPLTGFMGWADYECVLGEMRLANGLVWSLPITLPVDDDLAANIKEGQEIALVRGDTIVAIMEVSEKFPYDKRREATKVYQTTDDKHPGVARLYQQGNVLLGGDIWLLNWPEPQQFPELRYTPQKTREKFAENGWFQIVGFQTRNPINCGHEHVLKTALKTADGLYLHPLVGETKPDDISAEARVKSYQVLLDNYYPSEPVLLGVFPAAMRYAGPREAIFHALCRKNYGCTHFIVGRDHAGVGGFYSLNAACDIFAKFSQEEIGIKPLFFPDILYYCRKCGGVVTSTACSHENKRYYLNGTEVRQRLNRGKMPPEEVMRPEMSRELMRAVYGRKPMGYLIWHAIQVLVSDTWSFIPRFSAAIEDWHRARPEKLSRKIGYYIYHAIQVLISKPQSFMRRFRAAVEDQHRAWPEKLGRRIGYHIYHAIQVLISQPQGFMRRFRAAVIDWHRAQSETQNLKQNPGPDNPRSTQ